MSMKIGRGRGKKGDGLHINRDTKQRSYGRARSMSALSYAQLGAMAMNPNTRPKDRAKLKMEIEKRAKHAIANMTQSQRMATLVELKTAEL